MFFIVCDIKKLYAHNHKLYFKILYITNITKVCKCWWPWHRTCIHEILVSIIICHYCNDHRVGWNSWKVRYIICMTIFQHLRYPQQDSFWYIHLIGFRCDFYAYCIFSLVNTVVYCIPAGWLWGEHGFLYHLGVVDIAGSGGVHLIGGTSGNIARAKQSWDINNNINSMPSNNRSINTNFIFIAFVAAKTMGPRLGRWDIDGDPPMGSPANAVVGLFMLWWGWLAFNAGSTFGEQHCC